MRIPHRSAVRSRSDRLPDAPPLDALQRSHRRHIRIFFADLILDMIGFSLLSPTTVVQEFLTHLTRLNFVIGLLPALQGALVSATQLFAARIVERVSDTKGYAIRVRMASRSQYLIMALLIPVLATSRPHTMLVVTLVFGGLFWALTGFNTPAYSVLLSKTVPAPRRGQVLSVGCAVGSLCAMVSGLGVARLLRAEPPWGGFPNGYALSIGGGALVLLSQFVTTILIQEPPDEEPTTEAPLGKYVRELWLILHGNVDFRRYVGVAWCATVCQAGVGFYMSYAIRELGAPAGHSGIFMSIMTATGGVAGFLWGHVSRRRGNLAMVRYGTLLLAIGALWAALSPSLRAFYPALVWTAMGSWGFELGGYSLQLDFGRGRRVARTVAVAQTALLVPRMCAPILAGLAADTLGFRPMFAIAAICAAVAFLASFRIRDPRDRDTHRPAAGDSVAV